jgi:hypothetical protein
MKTSHWPFSIATSLFATSLFAIAATACGGSGSPSGSGPDAGTGGSTDGGGEIPPPPSDEDYIYPDTAHTGFDGMHTFKVPVSTNLTGTVSWQIADPSIGDITPVATPPEYVDFGETWALVTTKKAGTTTVTATSGGKSVTGMLVVSAYAAADVSTGEKRYNMPDNPTGTQRNACVSCHGLANGVDHSPVAMAYYADDEIISVVTTGMFPDGYVLQGVNHAWNFTDAEKQGIVPYLRALPPKGF